MWAEAWFVFERGIGKETVMMQRGAPAWGYDRSG